MAPFEEGADGGGLVHESPSPSPAPARGPGGCKSHVEKKDSSPVDARAEEVAARTQVSLKEGVPISSHSAPGDLHLALTPPLRPRPSKKETGIQALIEFHNCWDR